MTYPAPRRSDLRDDARTPASELVRTQTRRPTPVRHGPPEFASRLREAERIELQEWLAAEDRAASGRALGFSIVLTLVGVGVAWASGIWIPLE
jgi:hypothetical protein